MKRIGLKGIVGKGGGRVRGNCWKVDGVGLGGIIGKESGGRLIGIVGKGRGIGFGGIVEKERGLKVKRNCWKGGIGLNGIVGKGWNRVRGNCWKGDGGKVKGNCYKLVGVGYDSGILLERGGGRGVGKHVVRIKLT